MSAPTDVSKGTFEKRRDRWACVKMRSSPQLPSPRIEFACAFHAAIGRLVTIDHRTTQPSASPLSSREFSRKKCSAWICAVWPRRMYVGCGGRPCVLWMAVVIVFSDPDELQCLLDSRREYLY